LEDILVGVRHFDSSRDGGIDFIKFNWLSISMKIVIYVCEQLFRETF